MAGKKLYGKEALVHDIANEFSMPSSKAAQLADFVLESITNAVVSGELVKLGRLCTLRLKERAARSGTDPRTGATIEIPKSYSVKANISASLRNTLRSRDIEH